MEKIISTHTVRIWSEIHKPGNGLMYYKYYEEWVVGDTTHSQSNYEDLVVAEWRQDLLNGINGGDFGPSHYQLVPKDRNNMELGFFPVPLLWDEDEELTPELLVLKDEIEALIGLHD